MEFAVRNQSNPPPETGVPNKLNIKNKVSHIIIMSLTSRPSYSFFSNQGTVL